MDGIDRLLQIVAYYRRRQPQSPEVKPTTAALSSLTRRAQNRRKVLAFHPSRPSIAFSVHHRCFLSRGNKKKKWMYSHFRPPRKSTQCVIFPAINSLFVRAVAKMVMSRMHAPCTGGRVRGELV